MIWLIKVLVYDIILNPILSSKFNVTIEPRFMVVEPYSEFINSGSYILHCTPGG